MIASFSALGVHLQSIALIVLHSLEVCLMIQCLHKLSPLCLLCSFVILVISYVISGRLGEVESLDLRSSRALIFSNISVVTGFVLNRCHPEGMWCDTALRIMACKIFSPFWQLVGSRLLLSLSSISLLYRSQFSLFQVDAGMMLYRVDSDVHLQTNEDW